MIFQPIFNQRSTSMPPENIRKPEVFCFHAYGSGTLVENGLDDSKEHTNEWNHVVVQ